MSAGSAVHDVAEFLRAHPPFDALDPDAVERVAATAEVEFHAARWALEGTRYELFAAPGRVAPSVTRRIRDPNAGSSDRAICRAISIDESLRRTTPGPRPGTRGAQRLSLIG